jgi:hypothetical protein
MRHLIGFGTPKGAAEAWNLVFVGVQTEIDWILLIFAVREDLPDSWATIAVVSVAVW